MSITLPTIETLQADATASARRPQRARWPLFGILAGALSFVSASAALGTGVKEDDVAKGVGVIDQLHRGGYYVSFISGLLGVAALFLAATGWKRWAEHRAPRDLAARTIGAALTATATINVIFVCLAGSMALYLKGGTDEGSLSREGIFVNYSLLDFGQLLGWWGGIVAAGCVATLSLRRHRVLPRWMGVVSIVLMLPALVFAAATSLPGFVGLTMPIWLVVISIGLLFSTTAEA
jgi:hypothetical protein